MIHSCLVWFLWWLRHGAIGPIEATSFVGSMSTDPNSEFTHFNSVIRLSKVQQFALRFVSLFESPAIPAVPEIPVTYSFMCSCAELQKPPFLQQLLQIQTSCHDMVNRQVHAFQVWSFFFWWLSGEVIHFVHLIRWNSYSCLCHWGTTWTRACCGTIARNLGLGTESCYLNTCFGALVIHQLVPHLVPNSPCVPLRNVSWGLGVCAVLVMSVSPCRLVSEVRLFPSPPCAVFGRLPVVCPLFSSFCLSGLTRLRPGVCVCV